VKDGKGRTVAGQVIRGLNRYGVSVMDVGGIASDGASAMTGKHSGAVTLLKRHAPAAVNVHDAAHRVRMCVHFSIVVFDHMFYRQAWAFKVRCLLSRTYRLYLFRHSGICTITITRVIFALRQSGRSSKQPIPVTKH
jgi:hypothetical protein